MTGDDVVEGTPALRALCRTLDAVPGPMREAFAARLRELERGSALARSWSEDREWHDRWYDQMVALLHLTLDDPRTVAQTATLVRWGVANGISEPRQRLALDALTWACRDVAPMHCTPAVIAELGARAAMIAAVAGRLSSA